MLPNINLKLEVDSNSPNINSFIYLNIEDLKYLFKTHLKIICYYNIYI